MKAQEEKLTRFFEGFDKKFIIPVYQRNYDWTKRQCTQLWNDLQDVIKHKRESHFFGSIVCVYDNETREFIIVDGQQRITTVSVLLLAIAHEMKESGNTDDKNMINEIEQEYLFGRYSGEKKIKLKLSRDDDSALEALFKQNWDDVPLSPLISNYQYFREELKREPSNLFEIFLAIKKLDVVDIRLNIHDDKPQLIFESLNSTGLALTEADKIRNFLLMTLEQKTQEEYYFQYWVKIEKLTDDRVEHFVRDFLTYKMHRIPNIRNVYFEFKAHKRKNGQDNEIKSIFEELLKFAKYYHGIIKSQYSSPEINKALQHLNRLDMSVCYPFLLGLFDDYAEKIIDEDTLKNILVTTECFLVRRFLCDVPTNALNKIFATLHRDIRKHFSYRENYFDIFKYILSRKQSGQRVPDNEELKETMLTKNMYDIKSKNKFHFFERIENFNQREQVNLQQLVDNEQLSIEHIMPQTLSKTWKDRLGENWEETYAKYLHTIGNLTFTAYNSEMSNKPFEEKRDMEDGFAKSRLFLNQFVKQQSHWNESVILKRANILIERVLQVWPMIITDYQKAHSTENEYGLEEEHNFTGKKIQYVVFLEQKLSVDSWRDFYKQICKLLFDLEPSKMQRFLSRDQEYLRVPLEITSGLYIDGHGSAESLISSIRDILSHLDIDEAEITVGLKEEDL